MSNWDWADSTASGCIYDQDDVTNTPEHRAPIAEALRRVHAEALARGREQGLREAAEAVIAAREERGGIWESGQYEDAIRALASAGGEEDSDGAD